MKASTVAIPQDSGLPAMVRARCERAVRNTGRTHTSHTCSAHMHDLFQGISFASHKFKNKIITNFKTGSAKH